MRKAGLMVLSGIVACAAGVTIATPAGAAASASARPAPGVTGKIVIKARVVRQCDGDRGSTAKESTMRFTDLRINANGRVRARQHLSGFEYASANDLDGRVAGRSIRGWLRSIDSDHGMGSGPGGDRLLYRTLPAQPSAEELGSVLGKLDARKAKGFPGDDGQARGPTHRQLQGSASEVRGA